MAEESKTRYTPRERVVLAYKGGFADRVPAYPIAGSFAGCLDGLSIDLVRAAAARQPRLRHVVHGGRAGVRPLGPDPRAVTAPLVQAASLWTTGTTRSPRSLMAFDGSPCRARAISFRPRRVSPSS